MEDLVASIRKLALTKTDTLIADFIIENLNSVGLKTATSFAEEVGVSDTSVIRFIRKLGFKGYSDFRAEMANRMLAEAKNRETVDSSPMQRYLRSQDEMAKEDLIGTVASYVVKNIEKSFSSISPKTLKQIGDILLSSKKKYVIGFRGTASCAKYMSSKLVLMMPNVISLTHADSSSIESIADITKDDCLFIYSFPRYSESTYFLMDTARSANAKIILVTDRYTSPLVNKADIVLTTSIGGLGFTNSYAAPIAVTELCLLEISRRNDKNVASHMAMIDRLVSQEKAY